nr:hybrid sensor histidine kinase/response regulator transcription factor [Carboxylicivirga sediminis]
MSLTGSRILLIAIVFLIKITDCNAFHRIYSFYHLTDNIALKQSSVNCIFQDSNGQMYFGTNEGLFLYDGYQTVLCWNATDANSILLANNTQSIIPLSNTSLLLSTLNGLYIFDVISRSFELIEFPYSNYGVLQLINGEQNIYGLSDLGLGKLRLDHAGGIYNVYYELYNDFDVKQTSSGLHRTGSYAVINSGAIIFTKGDGQIYSFDPCSEGIQRIWVQEEDITCLFEDSSGVVWIGSYNNAVYYWDSTTETRGTIQLDINKDSYETEKYISSICEDKDGNILIGTNNNGIGIIQSHAKYDSMPEIAYFSVDPGNTNSLCDNNVSCLYAERSNAVFVGTNGNGVNQLSVGQSCFTQYGVNELNDNSIDHFRVNAIYEDEEGFVWFGTRLGLNRLNKKNGIYERFNNANTKNTTPPKGVSYIGETTSFCRDSLGDLWIGTYGTGLYRYSYKDDRFYHYQDEYGNDMPADRITDIILDAEKKLWIATHSAGISKVESVDVKRNRLLVSYFKCDDNQVVGFAEQNVDNIFLDSKNHLWFSQRDKGLYRLSVEDGTMSHYEHVPGDSTALSNNTVISICSDDSGDIWFGTARGLNKFDIEDEYFTSFTMENGLPHNSICGVLSDDKNQIWLYTQRGIYRFNPITEVFESFIENTRIFHEDYTIDATFKSKDGKLFFGTMNNGCFEFYPDNVKDNLFVPSISITRFNVMSGMPAKQSDNLLKLDLQDDSVSVELNYQQNNLTIEFTAYAYHANLKLQLLYLMEGVDKEWHITNDRQKLIPYANLNPGKYTFKVRAVNQLNPVVYEEKQISIVIHPPFYATKLAYSFYVLLLLAIAYVLYRYILSRIRLRNDLRIERMKLSLFTNISHEFRTPLTLIAGPLKKLRRNGKTMAEEERQYHYSLMTKSVEKLMRMVNQILDTQKIDDQKMVLTTEKTDIVHLVKDVFENFNIIAHEKAISYSFKASIKSVICYCDKDKMEKILYNLLSNAFKYTPSKGSIDVKLDLEEEKDCVVIYVQDSGRGIPDEQKKRIFERFHRIEDGIEHTTHGTGLGLSIVKTFVDMHKGEVTVRNNAKKGCTFIVKIPIIRQSHCDVEIHDSYANAAVMNRFDNSNEIRPVSENSYNKKKRKVLIDVPLVLLVEDNDEVREFIEDHLTKSYRIITAANGKEGLEKALGAFPDLIVSDVMMPEMNGLELCRKLKMDIRTSHIPVILLTARSSIEEQIQGVECGADAYITKPFEPFYLEARIKNLIITRQKLRDTFSLGEHANVSKEFGMEMPNSLDAEFLKKAQDLVTTHLDDVNLTVPEFTRLMGVSNTVLYLKIKALTGLSANEFIRHVRLKKSIDLLESNSFTVSEISNMVGFNDPKYFSTCFKKAYGVSPSQYVSKYNSD